jgi:hypothetical protein
VSFPTADGTVTFADDFSHDITDGTVTSQSRVTAAAFIGTPLPGGTGNLEGIPDVRNGEVRLIHQLASDIFSETPMMEQLFISEISDPADSANAKFIEFYNNGMVAIDFDAEVWFLARQSGGGSFSSLQLTGSVASKSTYTVSGNSVNFFNAYGFNADLTNPSGQFVASGNGDDAYFLFKGGDQDAGTLVDIYGERDVDGNNPTIQPWFYADGRAERVMPVTNPNTTWTASEWTITRPANTSDMTPGSHNEVEPVNNVTLSVDNTSIDEDGGIAMLTATLSSDTTVDITVNLVYSGTATATADYTGATSITITAGNTTGMVAITGVDDADEEASETIGVKISSANVEIGIPDSVGVTIRDNDRIVVVTPISTIRDAFDVDNDSTFDSDVYVAGIVISELSSNNDQNIIVQDAGAGIIIRANSSQVSQRGDSVLVNLNGGTLGDFNGLVQVQGLDIIAVENKGASTLPAVQEITLTQLNSGSFESQLVRVSNVSFPSADGTIAFVDDFSHDIIDGTVTSQSRATATAFRDTPLPRGTGNLEGIPDVRNGEIRLIHQLASDIFADFLPTVTLTASPTEIDEDGTSTITATLSAATSVDVTIRLSFAGTATSGDYDSSADSILVMAGDTFASITISSVDDADEEDAETVIVAISDVTNGTESGAQSVTVSINANDPDVIAPTATITTTEVDGTDNTTIVYTVTFSEAIRDTTISASDFKVIGEGAGVTHFDTLSATVYEITVTIFTFSNPITLTLPANSVKDLAGNFNLAASSTQLVTDLEADLTKFGVNIFSNESAIFLQFANSKFAKSDISIYDLSGKVVFQATNSEKQNVEINSIQSGIFIVRMQNQAGTLIRRVFVK